MWVGGCGRVGIHLLYSTCLQCVGTTATRAHGQSHEWCAGFPTAPYRLQAEVGKGGLMWPAPISSAARQPLYARHIPQQAAYMHNSSRRKPHSKPHSNYEPDR